MNAADVFRVRAEADNPLTGGTLLALACTGCTWRLGFDDSADLHELNRSAGAHAAKEHGGPAPQTQYAASVSWSGREPVVYHADDADDRVRAEQAVEEFTAVGARASLVYRVFTASQWAEVES